MDPNLPFDDWIRFQHLQVLPIPARRNCRRQYPAPASATQSGNEPNCSGHPGIVCRGLAAPEFSERDWGVPEAAGVVALIRGSDFCHPDWIAHVLRRAAAPRAVLVEKRALSNIQEGRQIAT